jgi:hypothetical protein
MPLYNKSITYNREELDRISLSEASDMILCLRYLKFRRDGSLPLREYDERIKELQSHIDNIKRLQ